jgi:hypothetical protein
MDFRHKCKVFIWSAIVGAVTFVFYNFLQNILAGEEARVRKFILKGKRAVEEKNIFAVSDMLSANYQDKYGNSRSTLIYAAKEFFVYYKHILVSIEKMDIRLEDSRDKAEAVITALIIGKKDSGAQENVFEGERGRFLIKLLKEDKKWQLLELEFFEPIRIMGEEIS